MQTARAGSLEEKIEELKKLVDAAPEAVRRVYEDRLEMSWIYHDSALEGQVYTFQELKAAMDNQPITDTSLIPLYDDIRQCKAAIDVLKELAQKRGTINLDTLKRIYLTLAPDDAEGKGQPKYRKDMPLHRLYFHEISQPDKIAYRLKQLTEWLASPEAKRSTHPVRLAAKAHHKFMQIYPYPKQSGRVGRLLMNLILMRAGYPAVIIHATERQRYYDALKTGANAVASLVSESLDASVESGIRYFQDAAMPKAAGRSF